MKKLFLAILFLLCAPWAAFAQEESQIATVEPVLKPIIQAKDFVEMGKNFIVDASSSVFLGEKNTARILWDFGDGTGVQNGEQVVHNYRNSGEYTLKLTIQQSRQTTSLERKVFAYSKLIVLLTDLTEEKEKIATLIENARKEGTYILLIESYASTTAFMAEENFYNKIVDQLGELGSAHSIVLWTRSGSGLNAITRLMRDKPDLQDVMKEKTIVIISERNLDTLWRIVQSNFDIIHPKHIVMTRQYELRNLITAPSAGVFMENLEKSISEFRIITEETGRLGPFNFLIYLVNFMITKGVPTNTIVLLLMLPVIVTLITFAKQVIGITTFGVYIPSVITLSFLALGLKFGLSILAVIILTGVLLRQFLDRFSILHFPRVAIIMTISSLILLMLLAFGTYLNISTISSIAVFPMLIMTTLAEKFAMAQSGQGLKGALLLLMETAFVSFMCYWVVESSVVQNWMLAYPETLLIILLFNIVLGRWTGLRLIEYFRFREVMKHTEE